MGRAAQIDFDTLEKEKKGAQIVCGGVPAVQKIDFATFGGKNKSKKVGSRGNLGNVEREFFFCDVFPYDVH